MELFSQRFAVRGRGSQRQLGPRATGQLGLAAAWTVSVGTTCREELGCEDRQESSKEQAVQGEQFPFVLHLLLRDLPGGSSWGCFLGYKDPLARAEGGSAGSTCGYSTGKLQMCAYWCLRAVVAQCHRLGGLAQRGARSSLRRLEVRIQVWQGRAVCRGPGEGSPWALRSRWFPRWPGLLACRCFTRSSHGLSPLCLSVQVCLLFHKSTSHWCGPHPDAV